MFVFCVGLFFAFHLGGEKDCIGGHVADEGICISSVDGDGVVLKIVNCLFADL